MKESMLGRPYWWQWPTVLSLDAPAVALVWQWQMARVAGVVLAPSRSLILGAAVWLVYSADRWIEGRRLSAKDIRTQRHYFYYRWSRPVMFAWIAVALAGLAMAFTCLSGREIAAGLALLTPVLVYLISHQHLHRHSPWRIPKEICVGVLFGAGVAVLVAAAPAASLRDLAGPLGVFTLLCFSNCALISSWEKAVDHSHGQVSFARQFPRGAALGHALPWILAGIAVVLGFHLVGAVRSALMCTATSGALLGLVDAAERRIGRELARVLADVALMTPLLPMVSHLLMRSA